MFGLESQIINSPRKAVISMIAFFDLFDSPLTIYEIYKNFSGKLELKKIYEILDLEVIQQTGIIQQKDGFYFLSGRVEIIKIRQQRYNYTNRKIKIARRFSRLFSLFPFIKVITLANVIGSYNLRDGSDIDFFIITAAKRVWLSRLYCTGLAKILNSRPNAQTKKDKICLSFYISQEHLDLSDLRLSGDDPYFDYWYLGLILLYNKNKVYEQFLQSNEFNNKLNVLKPSNSFATGCVGSFLENQAKKIQLKIMPSNLKMAINNSDGVVVNDQVLKFYQHDRRREYAEKYGNKIHEIFKENN